MQKPGKGTHRPQVRPAQQPTPQPQTRVSVVSQKFEGPIPPPDVLQRYDELMPGAASIIIEMAQNQAAHRQLLELEAQRADIAARDKQLDIEGSRISGILLNERLGVFLGWTVAAGCTSAAAWSMWVDKPWPITALFLSLPVASIINAIRAGSKK